MSIQVVCPSCKAAFKASETAAGKQARCPKCSGVIEIPAAGAAAAADDEIVDAEEASSQSLGDDAADEAFAGLTDPTGRKPCPLCGEMIVSDAVKCRYCGEVLDKSMAGVLGEAFDPARPGVAERSRGIGYHLLQPDCHRHRRHLDGRRGNDHWLLCPAEMHTMLSVARIDW